MRQNLTIKLSIFLLFLLLIAGCNRPTPTPTAVPEPTPSIEASTPVPDASATPSPTPEEADPEATETPELAPADSLELWHSWSGADGDALAEILSAYLSANPDVEIETLFVSYGDLAQAYVDAIAAEGGPDLILAPNWWLQELHAAEAILAIDDQIAEEDLSNLAPAAVTNLRIEDQLYGLPTGYELVAFYYNGTLVADSDLPATLEELFAAASEDPTLGIGLYANLYHLYWGIPAHGAQLFDSEGRVILDESDGTAEYLSLLKAIDELEGSYVDLDYGMLIDRFKKGEFAYFVDGPWSLAELEEALGDDLRVGTLPAGPVAPAQPWLSADGIFFNPISDEGRRLRALDLARHLTSAESGEILATVARQIPARLDVDLDADSRLAGFVEQARQAQPEPHQAEMEEVWGYAGDMILKVLAGSDEPADAVIEAAALINEANDK